MPAVVGKEESVLAKKRVVTTVAGAQAIGHRLAEVRKARGITQVELAQRLEVSQAVISQYERGRLLLHGELIAELSSILRISADDLLGVQRKKDARVVPGAPIIDKTLARRLAQLQRLPRRDRDALLRTLDAFLVKSRAA